MHLHEVGEILLAGTTGRGPHVDESEFRGLARGQAFLELAPFQRLELDGRGRSPIIGRGTAGKAGEHKPGSHEAWREHGEKQSHGASPERPLRRAKARIPRNRTRARRAAEMVPAALLCSPQEIESGQIIGSVNPTSVVALVLHAATLGGSFLDRDWLPREQGVNGVTEGVLGDLRLV